MAAPIRRRGAGLDRSWHRPGRVGYAVQRLRGIVRPPVEVYAPAPEAVVCEPDQPVVTRDGTTLRVNVYRPPDNSPHPVILSAHPYGKDKVPRPSRRGYRFSPQYRMLRQPRPVRFSTLTSWEAPDPAWWVAQGYAVLNADLRGCGTSDGRADLLSAQEADDIADLIAWASSQEWSTGAVGMLGVSYLAMAQYGTAASRPPALRAICPWEGLTDLYADLMRPGGMYEDGFSRIWAAGLRHTARLAVDLGREQRRRPLREQWWRDREPDLATIDVPMLVCASFSDNNLHSRGSFRALQQVGSAERFAWTHRDGKWCTFYDEPARRAQLAFFDRYLREVPGERPPRVRLEVREDRTTVVGVRTENEWPLKDTQWQPLYLADGGTLRNAAPDRDAAITFRSRREAACFDYRFPTDVELTGPMALRLWLRLVSGDDVDLVVGVEKWRGRHYVGFEGSYGFGRDRVSTGWQRASLRALDQTRSTAAEPVHRFDRPQPVHAGEVVNVDIALGPSATLFRAGETLRLVVGGRWLWPANPLTGQFPARYSGSAASTCVLLWGPERPARLLVPRIPSRSG